LRGIGLAASGLKDQMVMHVKSFVSLWFKQWCI